MRSEVSPTGQSGQSDGLPAATLTIYRRPRGGRASPTYTGYAYVEPGKHGRSSSTGITGFDSPYHPIIGLFGLVTS